MTDDDRKVIKEVLGDLQFLFDGMEKVDEFRATLLENEDFFDCCKQFYRKGEDNTAFEFGLLIEYDMWINNSNVWPVVNNPQWENKG